MALTARCGALLALVGLALLPGGRASSPKPKQVLTEAEREAAAAWMLGAVARQADAPHFDAQGLPQGGTDPRHAALLRFVGEEAKRACQDKRVTGLLYTVSCAGNKEVQLGGGSFHIQQTPVNVIGYFSGGADVATILEIREVAGTQPAMIWRQLVCTWGDNAWGPTIGFGPGPVRVRADDP